MLSSSIDYCVAADQSRMQGASTHWATSPGVLLHFFLKPRKAKPCFCYCLRAETQIAARWQRMQAPLAHFLGQPLLVRNFQPWRLVPISAVGCNHTHLCPPTSRADVENLCHPAWLASVEGLHWLMSAPHTHRFEIVSFSSA
jgi:hypothetical protein